MAKHKIALFANQGSDQLAAVREAMIEESGEPLVFDIQIGGASASRVTIGDSVLRWDDVGQLVLVYPEIHLITLAAFILIGRYSGYRLTELWRFRDLVKDEQTGQQTPDV